MVEALRRRTTVTTAEAKSCDTLSVMAAAGRPVTKKARVKLKKTGSVGLKLKLNPIGKRLLKCRTQQGQPLDVVVDTQVKRKGQRGKELLKFLVRAVRSGG